MRVNDSCFEILLREIRGIQARADAKALQNFLVLIEDVLGDQPNEMLLF